MLRVKMKSVTMAILLTLRHPIIVLMYALLYAGGIAYAHNGSSELSKDDRQQCDKMVDILKNYYETQGGRLNLQKQGYVLEHMPIYNQILTYPIMVSTLMLIIALIGLMKMVKLAKLAKYG